MRITAVVIAILFFCSQGKAGSKTKPFRANPDLVFKTALIIAQQNYSVKYSDKEARTLTFERPSGGFSTEFSGTITVEPFGTAGGSLVTFQFRSPMPLMGGTKLNAKRFFEELAAALGESEVKARKPKPEMRN